MHVFKFWCGDFMANFWFCSLSQPRFQARRGSDSKVSSSVATRMPHELRCGRLTPYLQIPLQPPPQTGSVHLRRQTGDPCVCDPGRASGTPGLIRPARHVPENASAGTIVMCVLGGTLAAPARPSFAMTARHIALGFVLCTDLFPSCAAQDFLHVGAEHAKNSLDHACCGQISDLAKTFGCGAHIWHLVKFSGLHRIAVDFKSGLQEGLDPKTP